MQGFVFVTSVHEEDGETPTWKKKLETNYDNDFWNMSNISSKC